MKTLVIGLDGVPYELLQKFAAEGICPRLAEAVAAGNLRRLAASVPEISAVSWSDFMTGADAGTHGIFGFTELQPGWTRVGFPRFTDLASPTLWDRLGERGKRSVVLNQPATFPARPLPGALVSGFVALDLKRATYPLKHLGALARLGYRIDVDTSRGLAEPEALLTDLEETLAGRERAAEYLWQAEPWDLFQVVVTGTDRLQHFLWDALEEADHPLHGRVLDYYRAVDALVGRLLDRFRAEHEDGVWFILSDHGFCRARREFRVNAWLRDKGYLRFKPGVAADLNGLDPAGPVLAMDPGRLYFRGRPAPALIEEITAGLMEVTWQGEQVLESVLRREDVYQGPRMRRGPHLVLQARPGFDLKGTLAADEAFATPRLPGMHDRSAFLLARRPLPEGGIPMARVAGLIEESCTS